MCAFLVPLRRVSGRCHANLGLGFFLESPGSTSQGEAPRGTGGGKEDPKALPGAMVFFIVDILICLVYREMSLKHFII